MIVKILWEQDHLQLRDEDGQITLRSSDGATRDIYIGLDFPSETTNRIRALAYALLKATGEEPQIESNSGVFVITDADHKEVLNSLGTHPSNKSWVINSMLETEPREYHVFQRIAVVEAAPKPERVIRKD